MQWPHLIWNPKCEAEGEKPVVVLLHGFPDCPSGWSALAEHFVGAGHKVIAPWLPGYLASSTWWQDKGIICGDITTIAQTMIDELKALQHECWLVGHDWGAVVVQAMVAEGYAGPAWMLSVPPFATVMRSMARGRQLWFSRYMLAFQAPGAESGLIRGDTVRNLWNRWSPDSVESAAPIAAHFRDPEVAIHAVQYYRALLGRGLSGSQWARNLRGLTKPLKRPVGIGFGVEDGCMHPSSFAGWQSSFVEPVAWQVRSFKAGHFLQYECPQELFEWISQTAVLFPA